ncbi:hypothetical protein AB3538_07705 [Acinetobacter baumannii]
MLTCRQATQLLSEKQDRPLFYVSKVVYNCICWHADKPLNCCLKNKIDRFLREQSSLQLHLLACRSCRRYAKQIKTISQLSKAFKNLDN